MTIVICNWKKKDNSQLDVH